MLGHGFKKPAYFQQDENLEAFLRLIHAHNLAIVNAAVVKETLGNIASLLAHNALFSTRGN